MIDVIAPRLVIAPLTQATLEDLADRLSRLAPSHRDPERFHVEKLGLVHDLRTLAREVRRV